MFKYKLVEYPSLSTPHILYEVYLASSLKMGGVAAGSSDRGGKGVVLEFFSLIIFRVRMGGASFDTQTQVLGT